MMTAHSFSRRMVSLLLLTLILGLALRLVGIGNDLPYVVGPDEGFEIHRALKLGRGEIDLERIGKGGFYYLLFAQYGVYYSTLRLSGDISSPAEFAAHFAADPTPFWLIGRVSHVAIAGLLILWTFFLGRRAYSPFVGLFGAASVALSPLLVERSRYVGVDLPMTLLAVMTIGLAHQNCDPDRKSRPVLLGCCLGLAVITKIPAVVLAIPVALAFWFRRKASPPGQSKPSRNVLSAYASAAVVAIALEPGLVLKGGAFLGRLGRLFGPSAPGSGGGLEPAEASNLWIFYGQAIVAALGVGGLALSLVGVALAMTRRKRADVLILSFVVPLLIVLTAQSSNLYYHRYIIPLIPFLALLAGRSVPAMAERLPLTRPFRTATATAVAVALLLPSGFASLRYVHHQQRSDTRIVARQWIEANVPAGSRVFLVGDPLSDAAPNLSLPLRKADALFDELIRRVERESPAKTQILRLRRHTASGVPYELITSRHFEPNEPLEEYVRRNVSLFVLLDPLFSPDHSSQDARHTAEVRASRVALWRDLKSYPSARRVLDLDPEKQQLKGPGLEIYQLESTGDSGNAAPGPV